MKKIIYAALAGFFIMGCATCKDCAQEAVSSAAAPVVPSAKWQKAVKEYPAADKKCSKDSDCVKIAKGCCECDGYDAVSKTSAERIKPALSEKCKTGVCTMQLCLNDITPVCENKVCTAKPAPGSFLSGK